MSKSFVTIHEILNLFIFYVKTVFLFPKASALTEELHSRLEEKSAIERELREELGSERDEKDRIDREREEFKFELELARNEVKTLKQKISTMSSEVLSVNTELDATKVLYT